MSNLLFQADTFVSSRALPTLSNIDDLIYIEKYETDAYGHWIFDNNDPLVSKSNGATLTVQAGATTQPVFSSIGVAIGASNGNALISGLTDDATQDVTMVLVCKTSDTTLNILGGTLTNSNSTTENGFGVFASANKTYINAKPLAASNTGGLSNVTTDQVITQTNYFLVAVTIAKSSKTLGIYTQQSNVESNKALIFSSVYDTSAKKVAVGNGYYTSTGAATQTVVEAIIYDKVLTVAQLQAVAARSKVRMLNRGIDF